MLQLYTFLFQGTTASKYYTILWMHFTTEWENQENGSLDYDNGVLR